MNVPLTSFQIVYNGKNITQSIVPFVKSFTYTDKAQGEADEIEIELEDSDRLWQFAWYPQKGDTITAKIFDVTGVLDCGTFEVDELSGRGSKSEGDTFTIRGIAAGVNAEIRTKNTRAHESKTLREIVNTVAAQHGFTVSGKIENVTLSRETQYRKTDLQYLQHLANEYGYTFSIRGKQLTFTSIFDLEGKDVQTVIPRDEITEWDITDKTANTYKSARVKHHSPKKKTVVSYDIAEGYDAYKNAKKDVLVIHKRAENKQQAEIKARVALYRANSLLQEGTLTTPGNATRVAGVMAEVQGIGNFSGKYYINSTTHTVSPDAGYTNSLEVKRVGLLAKEKQK